MSDPLEHLDMPPEQLLEDGQATLEWIADYLRGIRELPVLSPARPGDLLDALPEEGPEDPVDFSDSLEFITHRIIPGITHWNHPRFFAYFANTGSVPGILGTALAAALNPNAMTWRTSPAATELEQRVVAWLAAWSGLERDSFGMINDTASVSSLCALAAARQVVPGYDADTGMASLDRPLRVYVSEEAHSSIHKAALLLGLGRQAVAPIPTGADYALDAEALVAAIEADRKAGRRPFCAVATLGTTSSTGVDPVAEMEEICRRYDLWLHVDAAYAGAAAILPELRPLFAGWERADSVVINPHKWLFTPMCCSLLYCRRPRALRAAFSLVPEYLRTDVADDRTSVAAAEDLPVDFMNYGIQLGRPFRALKLWLVLRAYGRRGIEARLRHHVELARDLAARIDRHPDFERLAPTPFSTVCFRYRPAAGPETGDGSELPAVEEDPWADANERLMAAVNAAGETFLSHTRLRGRFTLRLAIGNLRTEEEDVRAAWSALQRQGDALGEI